MKVSGVLVISLLLAGGMHAQVQGPALTIRIGGGGQPMLLDSTRGYSGGFNPATHGAGSLTVNPATGTVYGYDADQYGYEVARFDPAAEYEKGGAATDGMGTTHLYNIQNYLYQGTVAGGVSVPNILMRSVTCDPNIGTGIYKGVLAGGDTGGTPTWKEHLAQTAAEALGQLNEGTVAVPNDKSAWLTTVTMQDGISSLGGGGHWGSQLLADSFRGQFTPINDAAGSFLMSRYFMLGPGGNRWLIVLHAKAARETEPTATTVGTRRAYKRNRTDASCRLLTHTAFTELVAGVADDIGDMEQDPVTGDLYFTTATTAPDETYLSAIRPVIPDDSTQALSYEAVDLDPDSDNTYLALSSLHADLAYGAGIAFSADGSILYVSVMSTAGGAVRAVYAVDRTASQVVRLQTVIIVK